MPAAPLDEIESITIGHYDSRAPAFWEGTKDHDVTQNYSALLEQYPAGKALDILDFGCGPGRDVAYFKSLGHRPVGLDGSPQFCQMARDYTGCPVLNQQFLQLQLAPSSYDGVFANASLFHIPSWELARVLSELLQALRPGGILFSSNPRGNQEGWSGERYSHYMEFEVFHRYLQGAGFEVLRHYYRPTGRPQRAPLRGPRLQRSWRCQHRSPRKRTRQTFSCAGVGDDRPAASASFHARRLRLRPVGFRPTQYLQATVDRGLIFPISHGNGRPRISAWAAIRRYAVSRPLRP